MPRRFNRQRRSTAPIRVQTQATSSSPTGHNSYEFTHAFTTAGNYDIPVGKLGAPSRPTSLTITLASDASATVTGTAATYKVYAFAGDGKQVFESRPIVVCGNSVDFICRAPKSTDFLVPTATGVLWRVQLMGTGARFGSIAGVASGSYRGGGTPDFSPSFTATDEPLGL